MSSHRLPLLCRVNVHGWRWGVRWTEPRLGGAPVARLRQCLADLSVWECDPEDALTRRSVDKEVPQNRHRRPTPDDVRLPW